MILDALRRVRNTKAQVNLDPEQRKKNLAGAFVVRDRDAITHKAVILVDDVTTTGATLEAAAQVLRKAGAVAVYALVVSQAHPAAGDTSPNQRAKSR
jgi:predicted amidophosphoribosyltransferase